MRPAVVFAVIALSAVAGAQSVSLRYKFRVGDVHTYTSNMAMDMKMNVGGRAMPTNTNMKMTMTQRVTSVGRDGTGTIQSSMQVLNGTVNGRSNPSFESANGKTFTIKMSPVGKVSGMSGSALKSMQQEGFDPSEMELGSAFPEGPVHIGSHWTKSTTIPKLGPINLHYTLVGLQSNGHSQMATIRATGLIDLGKMTSAMAGQALQGMHMNGSENMSMTIKFNVTAGLMQEMSMDGKMLMNMSMPSSGSGKTTNMSMTGNQKMSMRLTR
jgi:hypothetical protein